MPADPSPDDKRNVAEESTLGDDEWPVPPSDEDIVERLPDERGSIAVERPPHSRIAAAARVVALLTALVVLVLLGAGGAWL